MYSWWVTATDINQPVGIRLDTTVLRSTLTCLPPSYIHLDMSCRLSCYCLGQYHPQLHSTTETERSCSVTLQVCFSITIFSIERPHYVPFERGLFSNVTFFSSTDYVWCLFMDQFSRWMGFFFVLFWSLAYSQLVLLIMRGGIGSRFLRILPCHVNFSIQYLNFFCCFF